MAPPLLSIFKKAYWSLVALGGLYVIFLCCLTIPWLQRQALYAHNFNTVFWHDLGQPEQFGYLNNQVHALNISTPDGETLYGWHVLPIAAYSKHEQALASPQSGPNFESTSAFGLLQDRNTKLVINFHGNAGHVGQGWRTDTYRALTAADNENIHVLAVDYRGFGHSTGFPTEVGIIIDAIATVRYALDIAKIPPERIVLVGQSLGVAVAIAVAEHFVLREKTEFSGLVLCAGFSDLPTLMGTYALFHAIPIFSPLRPYPRIHKFFSDRIVDKWPSTQRLYKMVKASTKTSIAIIHARNDYDIPWTHSNTLFHTAANATSANGMSLQEVDAAKDHQPLTRGGFINSWKAASETGGLKKIKQTVLRDGGHNRIMTYAHVTKAVIEAFR